MKTPAVLLILAVFLLFTFSANAQENAESESPPATESPASTPDPEAQDVSGAFTFGSYGRVQITDDGEGHPGRNSNVVAYGPRIFEPSYGELEFGYALQSEYGPDHRDIFGNRDEFGAKVLFTLALFEPTAHYSGSFDDRFAVRNMYAEAWGFIPYVKDLHIWAGSRMYRGDDIYLLDYWPLDNLNTVGGGLGYFWKYVEGQVHIGVNRLDNDFQFQKIEVPGLFNGQERLYLDRQRYITTYKLTGKWPNIYRTFGAKASVYGEMHKIRKGHRIPSELIQDEVPDYQPDTIDVNLPEEEGMVIGGQLGFWGFGQNSHLNLFVRWANDLAAYGEFGVPFGLNDDLTSEGASEFVGALSANWEFKWLGILAGGYIRKFMDADDNKYDLDDYVEGAFAVRPVVFITDHIQQGFEFGYQQHYPFGLDESTDDQEVAEVYQYSIMPIISAGRGSYKRPQFRFTYTISQPNASARRTAQTEDQERLRKTDHFFGFGVEWWFNSSTY